MQYADGNCMRVDAIVDIEAEAASLRRKYIIQVADAVSLVCQCACPTGSPGSFYAPGWFGDGASGLLEHKT